MKAFCLLPFVLAPPALADVTVFAAASLGGPLDEIAEAFEQEAGQSVTLSFAGSSAIARQVIAGAPADIVILANGLWMDEVEASGRLRPDTRRDLLSNRLVVIGSWHLERQIDLNTLPEELETQRLSLALTEAVPAGIYARESLEALGLWGQIAPQVVEADNVRAAQALVAMGAARFGIVYATDVANERRVRVVAEIPEDLHAPIRYPIALTEDAVAEAEAFLDYLDGPLARATLAGAGFGLIAQ